MFEEHEGFDGCPERLSGGTSEEVVYAPDGSQVAVMSGTSLVSFYVHLPMGAVAVYGPSGLNAYWHPDWLGTPRLYSSPTQTVLADVAVAAYGEQYQGPTVDGIGVRWKNETSF